MRRANYERESETVAFSGFLNAERQRILAAATPERRAQMEAAEESRAVYRAWNAVCSGTREGRHVTGLRYLPESNELLVYLDSPSWTQEMTLLREIIRARMERAGAHVDGLVFKTTAPGHTPPAAKERPRPATTERPPAPHADLSEDILGLCGILLQLSADVRHVDPEDLIIIVHIGTPDGIHDIAVCQNSAGIFR